MENVDISSTLSPEQEKAHVEICDRLEAGERFAGLRGYAGTGKTYLAGHLAEGLQAEGCNVAACAPTHKASQVLEAKLGGQDNGFEAEAQTFHSFLGLRLEPGKGGEYTLVKEEPPPFEEGVVIVDEASMIGRDGWQHIHESPGWLQWVMVGDPAQLPPVNEAPSPALDVPGPTLTTIHRQAAGNPILELATQVRKGTAHQVRSRFEDGRGVAVTDRRKPFLESILSAFEGDAFDEDPTHARVLAYRNDRVEWYNTRIRNELHGDDAERFVEEEWIVGRETWFHEGRERIKNSEEVRVVDVDTGLQTAPDQSEWKTWQLEVVAPTGEDRRTIEVLHESERERYEKKLTRRREKAEEDGSKWDRFFALKEQFAKVDYAYATTVHRAQGSTYDTVFVDYRDLQACRGEEQKALLYVAVTRPSRRLALLT